MTATIHYDKPVKNLIDQLSATGHVTHTKYKKKSVTLHHNGGRLSHEGVLAVWRTRPASAHFDVDAFGRVAQYVDVHEYAWAVANTQGNMETISIEQANTTLSPHWEVADPTWQEAARLAGWLFAHVVDGSPRPSRSNLFYHHHWYSTSCAGPYMDKIYDKVLAAAQAAYDHFRATRPAPAPAPAPHPTANPVELIQHVLRVPADGHWGPVTDARALTMRSAALTHAGYPHNSPQHFDVRVAQRVVGSNPDGIWGPNTQSSFITWLKPFQRALGVTGDGAWGPGSDHAFLTMRQAHLNK